MKKSVLVIDNDTDTCRELKSALEAGRNTTSRS